MSVDKQRPSEARDRLLRTASRLFYTKGINSVGVDQIISTAQVTRATFYRHFPSKDDLIVAHLREIDRLTREQFERVINGAESPVAAIHALAESIVQQIKSPDFRGCAFLNAAAEYPDRSSPVHQTVLEHRAWFLRTMTEVFERLLGRPGEGTARHFIMLRDGAMASGCLSDPDQVCDVFLNGVEGYMVHNKLLAEATP